MPFIKIKKTTIKYSNYVCRFYIRYTEYPFILFVFAIEKCVTNVVNEEQIKPELLVNLAATWLPKKD